MKSFKELPQSEAKQNEMNVWVKKIAKIHKTLS